MAESLLHEVLALGVNSKASDWHVKENSPVTLRISGNLVDTDLVPDRELMERIIQEMIPQEFMKKFVETGDVDASYVEDNVGRFRVNIHRQRAMYCIAMRHVKTEIMNFEQLGLPPAVKSIADAVRGVIIISGTTGSGKSTSLASMIEHINMNSRKHIITIEDPIEYEFFDKKSFIEQREIGLDSISFYSALVHALRQDPDVIMVGEMRDRESFEAALQAADTGHLVLTTLHSSNASQAINRILDFFPHEEHRAIREALSLNLKAVIAQRLMPRAIGGGVIPAVEIMTNTPMVRKLLEDNKLDKLALAVEGGGDSGMQSFNQALFKLINAGEITVEDAMLAATNPESLKMNLKGIFLDTSNQIIDS
ncbi:MAG: twitching motility protein [Lentisphaerae bacterium GWF2_44_16]|nr:MAG: twitching motility protein [Lentisphaerae bacterium GWF2_44_16]